MKEEIKRLDVKVFNNPLNLSILAVKEGECAPIGCCDAMFVKDGEWLLSRLFIQEKYRSQGVGGLLLENLKEQLSPSTNRDPFFKRIIVTPGGYGSDPEESALYYCAHGFKIHKDGYLFWDGLDEDPSVSGQFLRSKLESKL